jgi:putative ABC transport system substrate-binding protein
MLFRGIPRTELQEEFRNSLAQRGWVDGRNINIDGRAAEGRRGRLVKLARELISLKTNVLVTNSAPAARAAIIATKTIPIVTIGGNPVADELIVNPARPEANVTGLSGSESPEISGKRLELLKQALPNTGRVAVLLRPEIRNHRLHLRHVREAAKKLGISLQTVELEHLYGIENAFSKMIKPDAVLILPWAMDIPHQRDLILQEAAKKGLATMYTGRNFVASGGFMAYGPVATQLWRRAAIFVDKLLKGSAPSDLPVERPMHYELVINLKTASNFGLSISPELLLQANQVFK